ncbi:MAG: cell division protein ZapB [Treponema sp.]|nr:cell division protein ZapB [Treponema sp.]
MITLEQVQALEARIEKALAAIDRLSSENAALRDSAAREKRRAADLERAIEEYRKDQERIEQGILHALERLNAFEDAIQDPVPAGPVQTDKHVRTVSPSAPAASASGAPAAQKPAVPSRSAETARPEPALPAKEGTAPNPDPGADGAELEIF